MKTYITNDTQRLWCVLFPQQKGNATCYDDVDKLRKDLLYAGLPADKLLNFPNTTDYEGVSQNKYDGCTVYIMDVEG